MNITDGFVVRSSVKKIIKSSQSDIITSRALLGSLPHKVCHPPAINTPFHRNVSPYGILVHRSPPPPSSGKIQVLINFWADLPSLPIGSLVTSSNVRDLFGGGLGVINPTDPPPFGMFENYILNIVVKTIL
jgi:hypothetical protein